MTIYQAAPPFAPVPPATNVATVENRVLQLDCTPIIGGAVIATCTTTLTDLMGRGSVVSGLPNPDVASPLVNQSLSGSLLKVNHHYELEFLLLLDSGEDLLQVLTIRCLR